MNVPKSSRTRLLTSDARYPLGIKYRDLPVILFLCGILLIFFLFRQVLTEQKKEQEPVRMTVSLPSENIPKDLLLEIQNFPGLLHCRAAYSVQAEIKIGSFRTSTEILGVDLSAWPFEITKSAGAKRLGSAPLIVAGEDFFHNLADEYGAPITERQVQVFQEKIETLDIEITLSSGTASSSFSMGSVSSASMENTLSSQDTFSSSAAEDALFAETVPAAPQTGNPFSAWDTPSSFTGSFLALAKGDGLYMDAAQMKELLAAYQMPTGISHVELEIKGEQNAERAKKSLIKAGFTVE